MHTIIKLIKITTRNELRAKVIIIENNKNNNNTYFGSSLPRQRFASVTVKGPPAYIGGKIFVTHLHKSVYQAPYTTL